MKRRCSLRPLALTTTLLIAAASSLASADVELTQLQTLDELGAAFQRDVGAPRLVLLLSPT